MAPTTIASPLSERILIVLLFVAVLASAIAFVEPSPHDGLMVLLAVYAAAIGLRLDRALALPFVLLMAWNVAGAVALMRIAGDSKATQYVATSFYLALAATLFACLFAQNSMARLSTMRVAYILAALVAATAGICGYFHVFPGAFDMFTEYGRALGTFKDPNVYGPFLIWPASFVILRMVAQRITLRDLCISAVLLMGLLLSFSRGAWFHFGVSCGIGLVLSLLTAPDNRTRMRIFALSAAGVIALGVIFIALLSFHSIGNMVQERAHLIQDYDVGVGGRFRLQEFALRSMLDFPAGMGPFEFARAYGLQQHNVYLQAFLVYGWAGGCAYILLLVATLYAGLRASFIRAPWQPYAITAFGAFVGEVLEGAIIDTDHWRHFFLILGIVWGTAAASFRLRRERALPIVRAIPVGA